MYNNITLVGNWVADPEIRYSKNGTEIMNATVAVRDSFNKEHTDFIDITAFKKTALNAAEYTGKGSKILIEGKMQQQRWENNEGQKRSKHVVIANQIVFLDGKKMNHSSNQSNNQPNNQQQNQANNDPFRDNGEPIDISDSDLPF